MALTLGQLADRSIAERQARLDDEKRIKLIEEDIARERKWLLASASAFLLLSYAFDTWPWTVKYKGRRIFNGSGWIKPSSSASPSHNNESNAPSANGSSDSKKESSNATSPAIVSTRRPTTSHALPSSAVTHAFRTSAPAILSLTRATTTSTTIDRKYGKYKKMRLDDSVIRLRSSVYGTILGRDTLATSSNMSPMYDDNQTNSIDLANNKFQITLDSPAMHTAPNSWRFVSPAKDELADLPPGSVYLISGDVKKEVEPTLWTMTEGGALYAKLWPYRHAMTDTWRITTAPSIPTPSDSRRQAWLQGEDAAQSYTGTIRLRNNGAERYLCVTDRGTLGSSVLPLPATSLDLMLV